jgi:phosphoglycolate phosphatase-like HAD superfamily hydrolase
LYGITDFSDSLNSTKNKFYGIKLWVFDIAGTIVYEGNLVYKTVCNDINEVLMRAGKSDKQARLELCLEYSAMSELFEQLKAGGRNVVLNTGYDAKTASEIFTTLGWSVGNQVNASIIADDVDEGRPDPDMITLTTKQFNVDNSQQVLKAGDSGINIEEGKNTGCGLVLGVLSSAQNEQRLVKYSPDAVLDKLTELKEFI